MEVRRSVVEPSLDERSGDDDLPNQAPKFVKFVYTTVVLSLDEGWCDDEARTPRFLRWTKAGNSDNWTGSTFGWMPTCTHRPLLRDKQFLQVSRLKALSGMGTTVIEL